MSALPSKLTLIAAEPSAVLPPPAESARPHSATSPLTATVGLAAFIAALLLLRDVSLTLPLKAMLLVLVVAAAMIAIDLGRFRTDLRPSSGLAARPQNRLSANRIVRKLFGFAATLGTLYGAYSLLPEYAGDFYSPVWAAARAAAPWLAIVAPLYILYVDLRQSEPEDAYAQLGSLVIGQTEGVDWGCLAQHGKAWLVKGFFLPLMFVYLVGDLKDIWGTDFAQAFGSFSASYGFFNGAFFLVDLFFAVIGYSFTLRLLDTQIRSAEPTMTGWVVCIVCYQPFWGLVSRQYLSYEQDGFTWGDLVGGHSVLYAAWGTAILACLVVYSLSTLCFGLRFSNLTHRGIITSGPYRYTKHPAYIAKCLSFWLISIPFLSNQGLKAAVAQSLMLLLGNAIYVARAITEERHLVRDPVYREYQAYIRKHGIFACLHRLVPRAKLQFGESAR